MADRAAAEEPEQRPLTIPAEAEPRVLASRGALLAGEAGVSQFLDIGTGIPTSPNVHEVAQNDEPRARIVYVDNDPIVLTHARALLTSGPAGRTAYVEADLRDVDEILSAPDFVRRSIWAGPSRCS